MYLLIVVNDLIKQLPYFNLDKPDPVKLFPATKTSYQRKGTAFSMICTTDKLGYPEGRLEWFKEDCVDNRATRIIRHGNFFLALNFQNLTGDDTGTYRCQITNDIGSQESRFTLFVLGKQRTFSVPYTVGVTTEVSGY